jgi:S-formylglutathione hydrolase FrmB
MSVLALEWASSLLGKQTTTHILFPDSGTPPFPTLYLLHGLGDDSSTWLRNSRLNVYLAGIPLIVVMPDGYRSFYTNHESGFRYAEHIGQELTAQIDRMLPTRAERSGRAIGGLSMGGYGAMRVGLGYADRFCSIHSHSGALGWGTFDGDHRAKLLAARGPAFTEELRLVFGETPTGTRHDLLVLAREARDSGMLPAIRLDCGTEDQLIDDNRKMAARLREARIDHEFHEFSGCHDWNYWDQHIRGALAFHLRQLGVDLTEGSRQVLIPPPA